MAQLSLYIDEKTLHKIEVGAKIEHVSISKYVVRKLNESISHDWPEGYDKLFGVLDDDSFEVKKISNFSDDITREIL